MCCVHVIGLFINVYHVRCIFETHFCLLVFKGDDAILVKEKLDTLQHRFSDLTVKAADILQRAQAALPLVQQFYSSHNRLGDWMLQVESQLSSIEASGLDVQEQEIQVKLTYKK